MQQIHTTFEGRLVKLANKRIPEQSVRDGDKKDQAEDVVTALTLRFEDRTNGAQTFLEKLGPFAGIEVGHLFRPPLAFSQAVIPVDQVPKDLRTFRLTFDDTQLEARLERIKVRRTFKKDLDVVVYDLEFVAAQTGKEQLEALAFLPYYLGKREEDPETGRNRELSYFVQLEPMERAQAEELNTEPVEDYE